MDFNPAKSSVMLLDVNSCFATIEQQANPLLRGRPVAVAAFTTPSGCILASSVEAKRLEIKTGMRVAEGRAIYPKLIVLPPDPAKYRNVHSALKKLLLDYSDNVIPKSIDEFCLKLQIFREPELQAKEIKQRIKEEIGEWITVSIGIAPNRYLAKMAAGLIKPDGLVEINKDNFLKIYQNIRLTDLTGVKIGNEKRFNKLGIYSIIDLYNYLRPIYGIYWYLRLRGYEVDDIAFKRKSFGNEVALNLSKVSDISPVIARLAEKASARVRAGGFRARKSNVFISDYKIAVTFYDLIPGSSLQLDLFGENLKNENLENAIDKINRRWGNFVVGSARGFQAGNLILDRIAFGGISDL